MKTTKESLVKENAVLKDQMERLKALDLERRTVLSELLGSYEHTNYNGYSSTIQRKINVRDWLGVSFLIGELKSDADYSCVVESRDILRRENEDLRSEIRRLSHPDNK